MSGYIGKIAAIVTANTSDFTAKLAGAKEDLNKFSGSIQSTISSASNSATKSLNAIFTPLQKLQRALEVSTQSPLNLRTEGQVRELQALVSLSEGLAKPLAGATRQFEQLSQEAQANFLPALIRSQTAVKALQTQLETTGRASGSGFEQARRQIEQTTQAVQRLAQAQQLASKTLTGNELQFRNPRLFQTLSAGADVSQQAAALPASALQDGSIARQTNALKIYQDAAVAAEARIESLRLTPNIDPSVLKAAQADFERYATVAGRAAARVKTSIAAANAPVRADQRNFAITGQAQDFEQARRESQRLLGQVAQLPSGREAFSGRLTQLDDLVAAEDINELEQVRRLIADIQSSLSERRRLDIIDQAQLQAARQLAESLERIRENADFAITGRPQNLSQVQSELNGIIGQFDKLTEAQRTALGGGVTAVIGQIGLGNLDGAVDALNTLRTDAAAAITVNVETKTATDRIRAIADAWDYAVRGIPTSAAQIDSEFQSLASRIGKLRIEDRLNLDPLIRDFAESVQAGDPLISQFQRLLTLREQLDQIGSPPIPPNDRNRVRDLTGNLNLDATPVPGVFNEQSQKDIDALATRVGAVRQQLETLPNSLRTQFIPALQQAQQQLVALQNAPGATVAQIKRAADEVARLEAAAKRAQQALAIPTSRDFLGNISTQRAQGELEALRNILVQVGAQAGDRVSQAYDKLAAATRRAVAAGTLGLPQVQAELATLTAEAAAAAAATGKIGQGVAARQIARGGDISTKGFRNTGLALNQLAFAADDFFSVTGNAEQRIRAIGNNITQFGLIAGDTKGLFVALAAVLGAQLVVALIRYANGGRTAEDQTKALNDALSRQKSIFDELKQSIESLAGSLADNVFSKLNKDIKTFESSVSKLEQRLATARDERVAAGSAPEAAADQKRIERELGAVSEPIQVALLRRQQRENEEAILRAGAAASARAAPSQRDLADLLNTASNVRRGQFELERTSPFRDRAALPQAIQLQALAGAVPDGGGIESRRAQLQALRDAEGILAPTVEGFRRDPRAAFLGADLVGDPTEQFERLQQAIVLLEREITAIADRSIISALESIQGSGEKLAKDIGRLEEAVAANVDGASAELTAREQLGKQLQAARDALTLAAGIEDEAARQPVVASVEKEVNRIQEAIAARDNEVAAIDSARRSLETFRDSLARVSTDLANNVAQEARSSADQARRDANRELGILDADLGGRPQDVEASALRRDRLAGVAAAAERQAAQIAAANARAEIQFQREAQAGQLGANAQGLIRQRDQAQAVIDNRQSPADAVINAQATIDVINTELQRVFEGSDLGQAAAKLADEFNQAAAAAARQDELIQRGRELDLSPAEKAGRGLADDIRAIQERFAEDAKGVDPAQRADLLADAEADTARARDDALRGIAPAIFGLADAVQNAIVQGPSRAALEATDVSTLEGAKELNRLLRGDDAARNQDLVELQKQSNSLEELVRLARDGAQVAN